MSLLGRWNSKSDRSQVAHTYVPSALLGTWTIGVHGRRKLIKLKKLNKLNRAGGANGSPLAHSVLTNIVCGIEGMLLEAQMCIASLVSAYTNFRGRR